MTGEPLVLWHYMQEGDLLEYRDTYGNIKQVGPIAKIDWRSDRDQHPAATKKYVLVPALRDAEKLVSVPLDRVQAVFRGTQEIIRFKPDEVQGNYHCAICAQRDFDHTVPGNIFCSIACQLEWIERYYGDYPPGQNPIDKGEIIRTANCGDCRKLNRVYCPNCVD